jgi:single-strand DNA-binding protein
MSKGTVNKVILIGNLGSDPEVRQTPTGMMVVNLNIATTDATKDQQGGWQDRTEWHRVVMFGKTAEAASQYLRKGSKIFVDGRLQTRKWQDKNTGQDRYSTEIIANEFQFMDRAADRAGGGGYAPQPAPAAPRYEPDYYSPPSSAPPAAPSPGFNGSRGTEDFDDDIPF